VPPSPSLYPPIEIEENLEAEVPKVIEVEEEIRTRGEKEPEEGSASPLPTKSKKILAYVGLFCFVCLTFALIIAYFKINSRSVKEQIIAAEGVADVAMTLAYAQVNHITPQKQNWYDPAFLKNNLVAVLSAEYPSFANIDNQGQFKNCRYILRIYTSSDLQHFLVIAQPEPTLLHWLFPRATIAVDSKTMELRQIGSIKALNRLLANPNVLDSPQASEISYLVRQGELIPLSSFDSDKGFLPPKALALVRPNAENLIYNAPRYYHFSEVLLTKALGLLQIMGGSHEVTRLQQQMQELSKFSNLVLYSSQGMQKAIKAQKALAALIPNHPFLIAYLSLNGGGHITGSHLLLNEGYPDLLATGLNPMRIGSFDTISGNPNSSEIAYSTSNIPPAQLPHELPPDVDPHHPLYLQLISLASERKQALAVVTERMIVLLQSNNEGKSAAFSENFEKLLAWYVEVDKQQQEKIMEELATLYRNHSEMRLSQFASYVKAAQLGLIARETLNFWSQNDGIPQLSSEEVASMMHSIQSSKSFAELDAATSKAVEKLNLTNLSDPDKLIKYQNEMRLKVMQQLGKFIFSANNRLPPQNFNKDNKEHVAHILKTAWVTDTDEYDYYLSEYDILAEETEKP